MDIKIIEAEDLAQDNIEKPKTNVKHCGVKVCTTSTGICGSITHGWHEPDQNGYFTIGCFICARHYERMDHSVGKHWPFPKPLQQSPEDQYRVLQGKTRDAIFRILMDDGNMWIDELHAAVTKEIPEAPFDEMICEFVTGGKIQFVFPGPLVAIATRTRPRKA